jgi:hypothetical protein
MAGMCHALLKTHIYGICRKMDTARDHVKQSKPSSEGQRLHVVSFMRNLSLIYIYTQKHMTAIMEGLSGGDEKEREIELWGNTLCLCMKVAQSNTLKAVEK